MRTLVLFLMLFFALVSGVQASDSRSYDQTIEIVWDEAVKAVRDVDYALEDSDRSEHQLTMRTKWKPAPKRGLLMEVTLTSSGSQTSVRVRPAEPAKPEKVDKAIAKYLDALDERMELFR